jgi:hypothetical protein
VAGSRVTATRRSGLDLVAAVAGVVDRLSAAGIRAVSDVRNVNPPCVYVPPPRIAWRFGKGYADLGWAVAAVVPNSGRDAAIKNLGPLVGAAVDALSATPVTDGRPIDIASTDGAAPMPGYELTFTTRYQF